MFDGLSIFYIAKSIYYYSISVGPIITHTIYIEILTIFFIWQFDSFGFKLSN